MSLGVSRDSGLAALARYQRAWLGGDLVVGVTVAAYLVPQVTAYTTVAGLPPVTGLWAALQALGAYALLGSSPSLSLGPEATTALMTAMAIGPQAAGDPARNCFGAEWLRTCADGSDGHSLRPPFQAIVTA